MAIYGGSVVRICRGSGGEAAAAVRPVSAVYEDVDDGVAIAAPLCMHSDGGARRATMGPGKCGQLRRAMVLDRSEEGRKRQGKGFMTMERHTNAFDAAHRA